MLFAGRLFISTVSGTISPVINIDITAKRLIDTLISPKCEMDTHADAVVSAGGDNIPYLKSRSQQ